MIVVVPPVTVVWIISSLSEIRLRKVQRLNLVVSPENIHVEVPSIPKYSASERRSSETDWETSSSFLTAKVA